ncbi:MAG: adenylate/guanylate cyclase domain-containing protein [Verrucomicrobiota bacterium]
MTIGRQPLAGEGVATLRVPWRDRVVNRNHSQAWLEGETLRVERLPAVENRSEPNKFYSNEPHAQRCALEEPLSLEFGDSFSIGAHGRTAFFWLQSQSDLKQMLGQMRPFGGIPGEQTSEQMQSMVPSVDYDELEGLDDYSLRLQLKLLQQELPEKVLSGWTTEEELLTRAADFLKTALPGQLGVSVAFLAINPSQGRSMLSSDTSPSGYTPIPTPIPGVKPVKFRLLNQDPSTRADFRVSSTLLSQINLQNPSAQDTYLWNASDAGSNEISDSSILKRLDWVAILPVATLDSETGLYRDRRGRPVFLYVEARQSHSASAVAFVPFLRLIVSVVASLLSARERQRIQDQLSGHFSPALRRILHAGDVRQLQPTLAQCTVLFCDRRGASREMETASTDEDILHQLRENQEIVGEISATVFKHDGVITDFAGDGVLALWGWPVESTDHAIRAAITAESIANQLASRVELDSEGLSDAPVRMGISTGRIAVGDTGPVQQVHISVFGNVVNFGARLEALGKQFHVPALLSEDTMELMKDSGKIVRKLCYLRPAGFNRSYPIYELVLPKAVGGSGVDLDQIGEYEAALDAFVEQNWDKCRSLLKELPETDGPAHWLNEQANFFEKNDPGSNWQGEIASLAK